MVYMVQKCALNVEELCMDFDTEKLEYLLNAVRDDLCCNFIYDVLNDSEEDPHYSAVTATNRIKCYIDVMNSIGKELPYNDVKGFFNYYSFTEEEYQKFESSRKKESEYYTGKQF